MQRFAVNLVVIPLTGDITALASGTTYGTLAEAHNSAMTLAPPGWTAVDAPDLLPVGYDVAAVVMTRADAATMKAAVVTPDWWTPQEAANLFEAAVLDRAETRYADRIRERVRAHKAARQT